MVTDLVKKGKIAQFQLGYMYYTGLNKNKAFKNEVKNTSLTFDKLTIVLIRFFLKNITLVFLHF